MKKKILVIACFLTLNFIGFPFANYAEDENAQELKLYLGEMKILPANNPARIVIGNPKIADVTDVNKNEITIVPKQAGATNLVFWDNFGEQSYRIRVVTENLTDIKRRIDNLLASLNLPEVYTQTAEDEGKILLLGKVKLPQNREKIDVALGSLKDKTIDLIIVKEEESVVEIDVQVLELDKDATKTLGFSSPSSLSLTEVGTPGISNSGARFSSLFKILNLQRSDPGGVIPFNFKLDALIQEGKARVLSRPRLACQSGKEAELLVGGEKPILTSSAVFGGGTSTQVQYKEFGIKLKIKPTVTEEKRIRLSLSVEVSEVGEEEILGSTNNPIAKAFPLSKRNTSTELYLDNGQTLAIGGLIKQKHEEDITKTAFLGDLPIIGALFRKKVTSEGGGANQRGDVELFIALTPTIVGEGENVGADKKAAQESKENKPAIQPSVAGGQMLPEALAGYANAIQKRILENLSYPSLAKESGFQGTVKLSLHLSYRGELLEAMLKESSGYKVFDDQAISAAESTGSYPPFPASFEQKEVWVDIPIAYELN